MKIYWYKVLDDYMFEIDGEIYQADSRGNFISGFIKAPSFELFSEVVDEPLSAETCNHLDYVLKGPGVKVCLDCGCYL